MSRFGAVRAGITLAALIAFTTTAYAQTSASASSQVQSRLNELQRWLGDGANGQLWNSYLHLDLLAEQLRQPAKPDRAALIDVLGQLRSGAAGLELGPFVALRQAIEGWMRQLPAPPVAALPEVVSQAQGQFRPVSEREFQAAADQLRQAVQRLDRYLGRGANGQAWRDYLLWNDLQAILAEQPPKLPPESLDAIELRFNSERPGLDLPVFANVREALENYESAALVHLNPQVQQEAAKTLQFLAEKLAEYTQSPTQQGARDIGQVLGWLDLRGQAPELVADIRGHFRYPNFHLQVSEPLVGVGLARSVNRIEPVNDVILGTRIHGTGHTIGYVSTQLVPSSNNAIIDSLFTGVTHSRTVGRKDTATIHSAGTTRFQARKRIYVDAEGIKTVHATAAARTNTRTLGVDSGRGGILIGHIADKIARQRVAESKSQSERIAAEHAEDRIRRRVEDEANPELAEANQDFKRELRWPLLDEGQFPADMRFSTSHDYLYATGVQATEFQLAASTAPPPLRQRSDLGLRLHESTINNLADATLASEEVDEPEFQDWVRERLGRLPEGLESEPGRAPWIITFAEQRPISVTFGLNEIAVTLRVRRVEGVVSSRRRWEITGVYRLEKIPGGLRGVRQGPIEVIPPGYMNEGLSGSAAAERGSIQRQFEKDLFTETIEHHGLELPGDWEKAGTLPLVEAAAGYGWLMLGWVKP